MDDDELTEISELDVQKMSAVPNPASGTTFLLMKSAASGEPTDAEIAAALGGLDPYASARAAVEATALEKGFDMLRDRLVKDGVTDSAEHERAFAILRDKVGAAAKSGACSTCGGSGQGRHSQTGQFVIAPCPACNGTGGDEEAVIQNLVTKGYPVKNKKLKKGAVQDALAGNKLPTENGRVSGTLSADEIDPIFGGVAPAYVNKGIDGDDIAKVVAITAAAEVERAAKSVALVNALTAGVRDASYADQVGATAAAVAQAQANAAGPSTPGRSGGAGLLPVSDPRGQIASLGTSAGSPQAGQPQLNYAKEIKRLEKQLNDVTDPVVKAELNYKLSYARLVAGHQTGAI